MTAPSSPALAPSSPAEAARLAEQHGLRQVGVRPPLGAYIRDVWRRREFAGVLATSHAYAENQRTYLGQIWAVLNPVMNAIVYILIFGFLLDTKRGVTNIVGFIVVGTFMYRFFSESATAASKSISGNLSLVRSLQFPRAVMPISTVMANLASLVPAIGVMLFMIVVSGVVPDVEFHGVDWEWLLLPFAVALLYVFSLGVGLILARLVSFLPDLGNLIPFFLRLGMYASGVLFAIDHYVKEPTLAAIMSYQPVAVYLDLARQSVMDEPTIPLDGVKWAVGAGWAVVFFVIGFVFFWRAEGRYGRE